MSRKNNWIDLQLISDQRPKVSSVEFGGPPKTPRCRDVFDSDVGIEVDPEFPLAKGVAKVLALAANVLEKGTRFGFGVEGNQERFSSRF